MKKLLLLLPLLIFAVACEGNPAGPSDSDDDQDVSVIQIINIGGDHTHTGDKDDDGGDQNSPPTLIVPSTITSDVGDSVTADILASDPDGDPVTIGFDPQSAPRDCSISATGPTSARISCVISSSSPDDSPFTVRVTGDDGNGGSTVAFFVWVVNAPPEVS